MAGSAAPDRPFSGLERRPAIVGLAVFVGLLFGFWLAGTVNPSVWSQL